MLFILLKCLVIYWDCGIVCNERQITETLVWWEEVIAGYSKAVFELRDVRSNRWSQLWL